MVYPLFHQSLIFIIHLSNFKEIKVYIFFYTLACFKWSFYYEFSSIFGSLLWNFLWNVAAYYILRTNITLRMNTTSRLFVSVSNIKTLNQFIKDEDETPLCIFETIPIGIIQENAAKEYPAMCFKALRSHQFWRIVTTRSASSVRIKGRSIILIC